LIPLGPSYFLGDFGATLRGFEEDVKRDPRYGSAS